jgi:hypothetical protein
MTSERWPCSWIPLTLAALGWLAVSGCRSDDPVAPDPTLGSLTVTISSPVVMYTPVVVTGPGGFGSDVPASLEGPTGLAFDGENLWVTNSDNNTVVAFAPDQLESSGSPTPVITLSSTAGSLDQPTGLAFGNGPLWVANRNNNTLVAFSIAQREVSGAPVPEVMLQSTALASPVALAVEDIWDDIAERDASNLWVSNFTSNTVVKFAANQLLTSGTIVPSGTLSPVGTSLSAPAGLAFDQSAALRVANQAANTVVRFTVSQLASGGAQTPEVTMTGVGLSGPAAVALCPLFRASPGYHRHCAPV